jgi:hypothetical protein
MGRWLSHARPGGMRWAAPAIVIVLVVLGLAVVRRRPDAGPVGHPARPAQDPGEATLHVVHEVVTAGTPEAGGLQNRAETLDDRLERVITTKVEGEAPGDHEVWSNPSFQLYHGLSDDELREIRRNPERVVDRLLRSIAGAGDEARRQKILRSLEIYLDETKGLEPARQFLSRGVAMLASGLLPIRLETDLASALARRFLSAGMSEADRASFRERARVVLHGTLPHPDYAKVWAWSLAQLGGREDREIILGAWDRLDRNGRSKLRETALIGANDR